MNSCPRTFSARLFDLLSGESRMVTLRFSPSFGLSLPVFLLPPFGDRLAASAGRRVRGLVVDRWSSPWLASFDSVRHSNGATVDVA